ncbi:hypothetical protein WJX72_007478 [[Myrmecia] bisecta]|uniref:Uncharacterized protein n=1 Tax=[Myrmecia] bisecta TaxID=41462 RepID=A0AAW1PGX6_9CHLO
MAVCASLNTPGVVTYNQPPGPKRLQQRSASLTIGGFASRAIRLLGGGAVAERVVLSAAELYAKVGAELHPTVQHLLKIGVRPADVMRMVQNPALRPKNMAQLQQWIRKAIGETAGLHDRAWFYR